ncbi:alpha/beta-hydrolase [Plenodomus tracheiphilus IPT5]|uniref:Alpha/beta-hydrolase n=1 Tax=Plenodomus tracheiphilus IPT5 TaxID=1408161 RepID=A0A6A7AXV2_9PLEO|nr:alpha/beta-hydrolase [Plenodomus tracheiphilus IPT5]
MIKLPATLSNVTARVGPAFINPGGPGGSAVQTVVGIALGLFSTERLRESFDIIGVDPRGVGLSHQIKCNMTIFAERVSLFPQTEEEFATLVDKNRRLGESCRELTGPLFEHLDTISSAKDHEAVRVALNEGPMNFLGVSYGSQLGAQYAALFPNNIRTLTLDGILLHSQNEASNLIIEATSYEVGMKHYFDWATTNDLSVLKGQDVAAIWTELLANATEKPIPALSCNNIDCYSEVTAEDLLFNAHRLVAFAGERRPGLGGSWEVLSQALLNSTQGDASTLSSLLAIPEAINLPAIGCLDWTHFTTSVSEVLAAQAMLDAYAPFTRGATTMWQLQHACIGWPFEVKNPPKKLEIKTEATVLVSSPTSDPNTGMPWALGLMEEIENAVLLVREGDGHTSFLLGGETAEIMSEYLITGKAPAAGIITKS